MFQALNMDIATNKIDEDACACGPYMTYGGDQQ